MKAAQKESSIEMLQRELKEIQSSKVKDTKKLKELTKNFASHQKWDLAFEAFQLMTDEKQRNLLIADMIEEFLLPAKEISQAKKFAKYLVQDKEIQPLIMIRLSLVENDRENALKTAKTLTSPFARNYAYLHIIDSFLSSKEKAKAQEVCQLILENVRTIYDFKVRSYLLREIALNLYLAHREKELAKEAAAHIPDETIKKQVITKIDSKKW